MKCTITEHDLRMFTGTEHWYQHMLNNRVLYTDGAKFVAENAGAYWLIDEIALAQRFAPQLKTETFQVWTIKQHGNGAILNVDDGNGNLLYKKAIPFTDFPFESLPNLKLYVEASWEAEDSGERRTILLPDEH